MKGSSRSHATASSPSHSVLPPTGLERQVTTKTIQTRWDAQRGRQARARRQRAKRQLRATSTTRKAKPLRGTGERWDERRRQMQGSENNKISTYRQGWLTGRPKCERRKRLMPGSENSSGQKRLSWPRARRAGSRDRRRAAASAGGMRSRPTVVREQDGDAVATSYLSHQHQTDLEDDESD